MGLANRVVSDGTSREEAEKLALQIAEFPRIAMLSDRASAYEQNGLLEKEAIANELRLATDARAKEAQSGAKRFASGEGRHGNTTTNNRGSIDS